MGHHVVAVAQEEVLHHQLLHVLVHRLHLDVQHVLQEQQLVDHVVHQLPHAGVVATPHNATTRPLRLDHFVHRHHQRDHVVDELLEVLQRGRLTHERDDVLVIHYASRGGVDLTLQTVQRDSAHRDSHHGLGVVVELGADGEEREGVPRFRLGVNENEGTNVVVEELDCLRGEVHRQQLQKGNVLRHHILVHEVQRRSDQVIDVVVGEKEDYVLVVYLRRTERRLVLDILNQNGNGLDDLNLDLVTAVLLDDADNVLEHILF